MHRNAAQVLTAAQGLGLDITVRTFPDGTRTAVDAAAAVGTTVDRIVKSLVFLRDERPDQPVLALVAGSDRLDESKLAAACGVATVGRADAELVRAATGYPIGGVPPFAHPSPLPTFVDHAAARAGRGLGRGGHAPRRVRGRPRPAARRDQRRGGRPGRGP